MKTDDKEGLGFQITEKFTARALEALDELHAMQFAEGLRLNSAMSNVLVREQARIMRKYGETHPRSQEIAARIEANAEAKTAMFSRYTEAVTPVQKAGTGWAVDGFVRTANGEPVSGVTVAAYDRQGHWYQEFGYGCTNEKGYFSMVVEKLPDKKLRVYMRASKGKRLLPSNEVRLAPEPKSADRVEIIIGDIGGKDDCTSPAGGKDEASPPEQPVGGKETTAASVKETKDTGTTMASGPTDEQKAKTTKNETKKFKESGKKGPVGGTQKVPPKKGRK